LALPLRVLLCERRRAEHLGLLLLNGEPSKPDLLAEEEAEDDALL